MWLGIKHVGKSEFEPVVEELKAMDCAKRIAGFIASESCARRFEFYMARTKEEILSRLDPRREQNKADAFDDIESMFNDLDFTNEISDSSVAS